MNGFDRERALCVLRKLGAETSNSHGIIGIVPLDHRYRLPLCYPAGNSAPSFIWHKWRRRLRLQPEEFAKLTACTMSGEDALPLILSRYEL
jgi:hypothetical protein